MLLTKNGGDIYLYSNAVQVTSIEMMFSEIRKYIKKNKIDSYILINWKELKDNVEYVNVKNLVSEMEISNG